MARGGQVLRKTRISLAIAPLVLAAGCATIPPADETSQANAKVDPERLSQYIKTLSSDRFEGRAPGTPGETRTVDWLVTEFKMLGLQPGGPDGKFTQEVPLLHTSIDLDAPLPVNGPQGSETLAQGRDVYVSTQQDTDVARIDKAPLVFVGYGVTAPEQGWDDYKNVDLKGKVAVFLVNDPDFAAKPGEDPVGLFGGKAMTYYGRWSYKFEEAVRRGAVGALIVHDTAAAGYGWNTIVSPGGENYDLANPGAGRLALQGWLSADASQALFKRAGLDLAAQEVKARSRDFHPVALGGMTLSAAVPVKREHVTSHNVIGKIPGTAHPGETVVYGAHWDAYGIGTEADAQGRTIRAGALDDASGVAGLLELARLFKAGKPPQRTVLIAAWTAEERGLLGSEAFMASKLYPADKMVANITMDTLQPLGKARDFVLIGEGQNSLESDLAAAAAAQHRTITPDSKPQRGLYYRADHFSFAKRGVPALIIMALGGGVDLVDGGRARGDKWVSDFTANCYHQPCDVWSPDWDLSGAAQDIDLAYAIGDKLVHSREWPTWSKSSEFAGLRGK